jgi:hypothetical protein
MRNHFSHQSIKQTKGGKTMKGLSRSLVLVGVVLLSFVLLSACATSSKDSAADPAADGVVAGVYKNEALGITFTYPENYKMQPLQSETEVLRVANPTQYLLPVITLSVADVPYETLDPQIVMDSMKESLPGTKRYKVLSEKDMTLNDGTPAKSFTFKWTWSDGSSKLLSGALIANKDGKPVTCTSTTMLGGETMPDVLQAMCEAFKFD